MKVTPLAGLVLIVGLIVATAGLSAASQQQPTALTDDQVAAAIKAGQARKFGDHVSSCNAGPGFGASLGASLVGGIQPNGTFSVTASANFGRIAFMAANAKRLYLPFDETSVSQEMRATPTIYVHVEPNKPDRSGNTFNVPSPIERIVLKSKISESAVLQPISFETEPVEWGNLLGAKFVSNRAIATFSHPEFMELPVGDVDIVLVTEAGERRCKIGKGDQQKVFGRK